MSLQYQIDKYLFQPHTDPRKTSTSASNPKSGAASRQKLGTVRMIEAAFG
jgi:hypothetical protein